MNSLITSIQRMSVHDGPGIRSTVFLKGCNLRCQWCHNPETWSRDVQIQQNSDNCIMCHSCVNACSYGALSIDNNKIAINRTLCKKCGKCAEACPSKAIFTVGKELSATEIFNKLAKDKIFYEQSKGGVTISGGEPLLQWEFTLEILKKCKDNDIHTAIETNLHVEWDVIEAVSPYVDLWLCDLKIADAEKHKKYTGVSNDAIISNLRKLSQQGVPIIVKTPVIPTVNDSSDDIKQICEIVTKLDNIQHYELLRFHTLGFNKFSMLGMENPLEGVNELSKEKFEQLRSTAKATGINLK